MRFSLLLPLIALIASGPLCHGENPVSVGVYYFDGWSGINRHAANPEQPWAKHAPSHLTKRMVAEFPEREPVWGWRNDSLEIMERQIDLAADHGVAFFLFCWYWKDDKGPINAAAIQKDHHHTSLELFLRARNRHRIKYSLLIANHKGSEILGKENWRAGAKFWSRYFKDPQYMRVDGKPLLVIFGTGDQAIDNASLAVMQEMAKTEGLKEGLAIAGCGESARNKTGFTHSTHYNVTSGYAAGSEAHRFQELIDRAKPRWQGTKAQPHIPTLNSGWDKRPWEGPDGFHNQPAGWYFPDSSPELFQGFLSDAIQWMDDNPTKTTKERIVLVYAWNELGEGGYLVPTKGDPEAAKLKVIKDLTQARVKPLPRRVVTTGSETP